MLSADRMEPTLPLDAPSDDLRMRSANFGMAIAAKIPMMATTIISSMSVKPEAREPLLLFSVLMVCPLAAVNDIRDEFMGSAAPACAENLLDDCRPSKPFRQRNM